ncbi:MAG: FAD/NAD(P)-binding protein [Luteolibacter sp.]
MKSEILPVVVVGGGFSGTVTAIHLSRRLPEVPVFLVEEREEAGPGLAYQEVDPSCLLNVPAGNLSAFAREPGHFLRYARRVLGEGVMPEDFLPRKVYGEYLKSCLGEERSRNPLLQVLHRRVIDVSGSPDHSTAKVVFQDHSSIQASVVILATGNQGSAFSSSVWSEFTVPARDAVRLIRGEEGKELLVIGTGLTMIDAVLDLERRGVAKKIHAISRNGLLPQAYETPVTRDVPDLDHLPDSDLRKCVRLFRKAIAEREAAGGSWRDIFAVIRSSTPSLWQELSERDRARFLRLLSPFWEIHRHQCPSETRDRIDELIAAGKLELHRGTIVSVVKKGDRLHMGLAARSRDEATRWLEVDHILDATGPARDLAAADHPLIQNLLRRGFLKSDPHRLGAEVAADYRAIGRDGSPSGWLFVVGPMLRARYYEATAVHELKLHASAVATRVEKHLIAQGIVSAETEDEEEELSVLG